MRAVKFGGSSVDGAECLSAAGMTLARLREVGPVTAVVSAMAGVTDDLLRIATKAQVDDLRALGERHRSAYRALTGGVPEHFERRWAEVERDAALTAAVPETERALAAARFSGWGERLAVGLLAAAVMVAGARAFALDEAPVLLSGRADPGVTPEPSPLATRAWLLPRLAMPVMRGAIPILPGYIARDAEGRLTTLGRNASDHAAAVIAAALGAESLTIYSDVAGVYTADPRIAPDARLLSAVTYDEAAQIAARGAKALHPRVVEPLAWASIPLYLRAAAAPDAPGTDIGPRERLALRYTRDAAWVVASRPDTGGRHDAFSIVSAIRLPAWPERDDACDCAARAAHAVACRGVVQLTVARDELTVSAKREQAGEMVCALTAALAGCASRHARSGMATGA